MRVKTRPAAQAMRDVAAKKRVELIDVYRAFADNPPTLEYLSDGLHPDPRGHRVVAELMIERLVSPLGRRPVGF